MGEEKGTLVILGIILSVIFILTAYWAGTQRANANLIKKAVASERVKVEQEYKQIIATKDKAIAARDLRIQELTKEYDTLIFRLKQKASQTKKIKPPKDDQEILKRFKMMGYDGKIENN